MSVEIPAGAGIDVASVTVEVVGEDDIPLEAQNPRHVVGAGYELGPEGTTFVEPATVTVRTTRSELGLGATDELPALALASRSAEGVWERLEDLVVSEDGDAIVVSGTTSHFSTIWLIRGGIIWMICPYVVHTPLGEYPSYIAIAVGLVLPYVLDGHTVQTMLANTKDVYPASEPTEIDEMPFVILNPIAAYGAWNFIGFDVMDSSGAYVDPDANLAMTGQARFLLPDEGMVVTSAEGLLMGHGPCDLYPEIHDL